MKSLPVIFLLSAALQQSMGQDIDPNFLPPYGLRILTSERHSLNEAVIQADPAGQESTRLFATADETDPSLAWQFEVSSGAPTETQMFNGTNQLVILGEKFYMWDPEPASMEMIIPPLANAKSGYPGEPWPSAYISEKYAFNVTQDQEGRWMLQHGFDHGHWIAQPDSSDYHSEWRVLWWNGTANPNVEASNITISIEFISFPTLSD